ncbi:DUF4388 domain-containing protein [Iamia sp. SCSIO 61187]|uniref:DUF4388 domain-containing protein n=1 Tax=Iamia sp. SCSIO 61187 TaxID=2722752 RepID=UPI001C6325B1|nr:DUF4388 domain-containing protein [Iamia sp. SCSIO 61187]QYG93377.1 DUF4388 domain-containing protein [Iamia sp. SCSIO 61187]
MALQGTLDTFALADLVRLLATTGKTGELSIDGDRGPGRLWFADGQLVGGEPAADDLTDVVFALLRNHDGEFAFHADTGPDDAQDPRSALDVLAAAEARIEEWAPVEALVPSPAVGLTLREELADESVTIDGETWRRLVVVAGGTTAGAFGERLELDEQAAAFVIRDLVEAGLVEVGDEVVEDEPFVPIDDLLVEPAPEAAPLALVPDPVVEPAPEAASDAEAPVDPEAGAADPAVEVPAATAPDEPAPLADVLPDVEVVPPYDFGDWGAAVTRPEPEVAPADASALGPWEPLTPPVEPAADGLPTLDEGIAALAEPEAPAPPDASSYAVDLDSSLGGDLAGHTYLGSTPGTGLPEPLLETLPEEPPRSDPAPTAEPTADTWPAGTGAAGDLGVPMDSLSPAAARALAAAAAADDEPDDTDAGRRVLRRIISTGKG